MLPALFIPKTSSEWRSEWAVVWAVLGFPADDDDAEDEVDGVVALAVDDSEQRAPEPPPFADVAELVASSEDDVVDADADAMDAIIEEASRAASRTSIAPDRKPTGAVEEDGAGEENPP